MKKTYRLPFTAFIFFILVYFNQGISSLPSQCIYYLLRENWGLSATMIGLISCITGLAWYMKFIWGGLIDFCPIKGYNSKYYLYINYSLLILIYLYIVACGLTFWSLIVTGILINICIGFNDVANDKQMAILEKKHKLHGRIQALQWISLGVAGLIVSLVGARIAFSFPDTINYRIAYAFAGIIPALTIFYLFKYYKEKPIAKRVNSFLSMKKLVPILKNKQFILSLIFVACLQLCPSFGTALMIKAREQLGVGKLFLGYLGATGTVLCIVGYVLYYWKVHKFDMKHLLYFMVLFTGLTNLCYLYLPNQWYLVGYNIAFGAFGGITFLTLLAFFVKIIPSGFEAICYALVTSVSNLCGRGGNLLGGILYDNFGYATCVIVSSGLTLCCLMFIPYLKIGEKNEN